MPGLAAQKPSGVRWLVLGLACSISFLLYLHRYTWGFVKKDVQDEFGWDEVTLGWLDGLFAASYAVGQIPSGMLCDWFGAHLLLGSLIILWSLALAGTALAANLAGMAGARLLFGVTQAGCYPVLTKVSKNWFPIGLRTTAQGWIATFFGRAGGAMSFFLFGTVLLGLLGMPWRWAIGVFTVLGVVCGVLFLLLFRNRPEEHPWANEAEARLIVEDDPQAARASGSRLRWHALLRSPSVWFLFLRALASNLADVLYVYWIPLYLRTIWELSPTEAGGLAALPLIGGALGGAFSGWLQSRLMRGGTSRRWARSGVGFAGKFLAAGFMLLSMVFAHAALVALAFLVVKFFADWEQPAEWGTVTDIAGANSATVFACVNTIGAMGGFLAGPLTGLVLQSFGGGERPTAAGWNAVFIVIAAEYLVAACAWFFIDCRKAIET